jgi:hypothetical protein
MNLQIKRSPGAPTVLSYSQKSDSTLPVLKGLDHKAQRGQPLLRVFDRQILVAREELRLQQAARLPPSSPTLGAAWTARLLRRSTAWVGKDR